MSHGLLPLIPQPGIQRDGTFFDSAAYTNGVWTRFYKDRPRKIGGYSLVNRGNTEIVRTLFGAPLDNNLNVFLGRKSSVNSFILTQSGQTGNEVDRTPNADFVLQDNNLWTFDSITTVDPLTNIESSYFVAHVAPNGKDIANTEEGPIFYGTLNGIERLKPVYSTNGTVRTLQTASGGICVFGDILVKYGNGGTYYWTQPSLDDEFSPILNWDLSERRSVASSTKIVAATKTRGSGGEALLLLSLDNCVRSSFDGTNFRNTVVDETCSILSAKSLISLGGVAYWIGNHNPYIYNGIVDKLPNTTNLKFFYGTLNYEYKDKVFGFYNAHNEELWWLYPKGESTECNHAIFYHIPSKCWSDTPISRSSALQASTYRFPLMASSEPLNSVSNKNYGIWIHEIGTDAVEGSKTSAIPFYYDLNGIMLGSEGGDTDYQMRVFSVYPDFQQTGSMYIQLITRGYPKSSPEYSEPVFFTPTTEKVDFSINGRIVSVRFGSNERGAFCQGGKCMLEYGIKDSRGDARPSTKP